MRKNRTTTKYRNLRIKEDHEQGKTIQEIATAYFISEGRVKGIIRELTGETKPEISGEPLPLPTSEYSLAFATTSQGLVDDVCIKLAEGWKLQGGICRAPEWDYAQSKQIWYYTQAMYR